MHVTQMNKCVKEAFYAERNALYASEQAARVHRNTAALLALDVVPADDYDSIAAIELAAKIGLEPDIIEEVVTDSGHDWRKHQGWIKKDSNVFLFKVGDAGIYPVTVTTIDIAGLGDDAEFYRGEGDVPLLVNVGSLIPRRTASWGSVNILGTPTQDGDKLLVVGDDDIHMQDTASSAFSVVAVGSYKLSDIKKPDAFSQDLGDWLE